MIKMYECAEDKAFEKEANIWVTFYLMFANDDYRKCDNAFYNSIASGLFEETAESVRKANFEWVQSIKKAGVSEEDMLERMPEAKEYLKEEPDIS